MGQINVTLKDGIIKEFPSGITVGGIAKELGSGLFRAACAGRINGELVDLRTPVQEDAQVEICTFDDPDGKHAFWHTSSHILAQAVKRLFPEAKLGIGPAIETGYYYDFDVETPFTAEDLEKIEKEMKNIVKEKLEIEHFDLSVEDALELMKDEPFKIELIQELAEDGETISFYKQGDFVDLCAGPHLYDTSPVRALALTSATAAYWKGDQDNASLTRVYGVSFPKAADLEEHLAFLEEAKKRDHRRLGRELELFMISDKGMGFPFYLPNGMIIKNELLDYWRELHRKAGYQEISTPTMLRQELWEISGHWGHYQDNMYLSEIDEETYAIKPMNCPGGMLVYKNKMHSYRDLPIRVGELGHVHRHELSGALSGLMRVRAFTQDDAHIYMTPEQIKDEIKGVIALTGKIYETFGFEYYVELSTQPEDSMGKKEDWDRATLALKEAGEEAGLELIVNEGDGAFYGPKLDFMVKDSLGRPWQCGTIQLDFQMPERFELEYIGPDNKPHRPIMLHRAIYGSLERFIGILIEHFAGAFPAWLSPTQAIIIPIGDDQNDYANSIAAQLEKRDIRVSVDDRNEKMGYKIREAQLHKIPYMLVVGGKEVEDGTVSVRSRSLGDLGAMNPETFVETLDQEIREKALEPLVTKQD